jgi:argininosuccinate synthase
MSVPVSKAPNKADYVEIRFEAGVPVALNGTKMKGHELIQNLNEIGGAHAVGQTDLVENRLVGMKSRGAYETPGGTILYTALTALEHLTIERDTLHFKQQVALKYADLVYYGQWFHPLREALDVFVNKTQEATTGTVKVKLLKGRATVAATESKNSLYQHNLASFTMGAEYDGKDAIGFIKLFGLPMKVHAMRKRSGK